MQVGEPVRAQRGARKSSCQPYDAAPLLSQRQLLTKVWGPATSPPRGTLRPYLAQLRRKLEPDPPRPQCFQTEPSMGDRFQP